MIFRSFGQAHRSWIHLKSDSCHCLLKKNMCRRGRINTQDEENPWKEHEFWQPGSPANVKGMAQNAVRDMGNPHHDWALVGNAMISQQIISCYTRLPDESVSYRTISIHVLDSRLYHIIYIYIPESSKGVKFVPLNHQKKTWGLKFDTLGGSRYIYIYLIYLMNVTCFQGITWTDLATHLASQCLERFPQDSVEQGCSKDVARKSFIDMNC